MARIFFILMVVASAIFLITCERVDMYDLAESGPEPQAIFLWYGGYHSGDLGGRQGADELCRTWINNTVMTPMMKLSTVKAFLSVSYDDNMRDLVPEKYWDRPVYAVDSLYTFTYIGTWYGIFLTNSYMADIAGTLTSSTPWWSGSDTYGNALITENCGGWFSNSSLSYGRGGGATINDIANYQCDLSYPIICISY